jgi:PAS domain S-box-containing protein
MVTAMMGVIVLWAIVLSRRVFKLRKVCLDLRAAEQGYRQVFQYAPSGIIVYDVTPDFRFRLVAANPAAERMTGISASQTKGKLVDEIMPAETASALIAGFRACVTARAPISVQGSVALPAGLLRYQTTLIPMIDPKGRVHRLLSLPIDLTGKQLAEEALRESEQRYREIFENTSDGIFVIEVTEEQRFRLLDYNPAQEKMRGITAAEAVGRFIEDYLPAELAWRVKEANRRCIESGTAMRFEESFDSPGGRIHHVTTLVPVRDPTGRIARLIGVTRDDTERTRAEDTLRTHSSALEQSPSLIVITNPAGDIEYVNPKFTEVTGFELSEVVGKNPRMLKTEGTAAHEYRDMWETITSGSDWHGEFLNRKKNGEVYREQASISPIVDSMGVITHYVAVKEDVTERHILEERLRQAHKMDSIGRLAGGVAHDFNNILAVILGNVGLMREAALRDSQVSNGLEEIERAANRAASLTRQLLLFSRQRVMEAQPLDLGEIVAALTSMLRRVIREDIELVFQRPHGETRIRADAGMMDQVVMNLCVNARDAMPAGGRLTVGVQRVEIDRDATQRHPDSRAGSFVCLSVSDTGTGMDTETQRHIFEPFFTTKEVGKGTGLGLANVYGIVRQHHGWINVESTVGQGTTFEVYLPYDSQPGELKKTSDTGGLPGGTETVLLVEDDPDLRKFAVSWLRKLGYKVWEAESGADALSQWEKRMVEIDILLTDMVMPGGISGVELAEKLRGMNTRLKIIVTSGYSPEISRPDSLGARGMLYLPKPYSASQIARAVRGCLDRSIVGAAPEL